jgi:hypothetical protein
LTTYETRFGMTTADMESRLKTGQMEETLDTIDWCMELEALRLLEEQYNTLLGARVDYTILSIPFKLPDNSAFRRKPANKSGGYSSPIPGANPRGITAKKERQPPQNQRGYRPVSPQAVGYEPGMESINNLADRNNRNWGGYFIQRAIYLRQLIIILTF